MLRKGGSLSKSQTDEPCAVTFRLTVSDSLDAQGCGLDSLHAVPVELHAHALT